MVAVASNGAGYKRWWNGHLHGSEALQAPNRARHMVKRILRLLIRERGWPAIRSVAAEQRVSGPL